MWYLLGMDTRFAALISRFSTGEFAEAVQVSTTTVSKWKSALWLPRPSHYERLAAACGLSVAEIANAVSSDHIERSRARRAANLTSPSKES